ncbi:MAG TPA: PGPGW domain-containing protein [Acidimicrobiia bacterium]
MARITRIGIGLALILLGLFLLVLPGPGILTIAGGLAVLAPEFEWAQRLLDWMKSRYRQYFVTPEDAADETVPEPRV